MPYYDVSIPLKLKTLTYFHETEEDLTGFAVTVPLKDKLYDGIVLRRREAKPEKVENIRKIEAILGQVYLKKFIDFLVWMSSFYITETGSVLRLTFFQEIISYLKGKKKRESYCTKPENFEDLRILDSLSVKSDTFAKIIEAVKRRDYKTLLIHCPKITYEMKLMIDIAKEISSLNGQFLLLFPEIKEAEAIYQILRDKIGDDVLMLHSNLKSSECYSNIKRIFDNKARIIVGTRIALFAPLKNLSLIMLSQESSWLYKAEESPRYHARDAAIMRGFIEGCPVILCDTMPSVSSFWNSIRGKFEFIDDFSQVPHPDIRILKQPYMHIFNPEALFYLKLYEKEGVLVIVPRTGFSLLRCLECGDVLKCEKCGYSMVFHKETRHLECNRCNILLNAPEICPNCGGVKFNYAGIGIDRLREELANMFSHKNTIIKDYNFENEQIQGIFIGQARKVVKGYVPIFKCLIFVDFDFLLSISDYRALENAFGKVISLSHLVKNDGIIFIQTRNPESEFFKFLRSYNFKEFYLYEIKHRKEANFPPFVRLIKILIKLKKTASVSVHEKIKQFFKNKLNAEIIGPLKNNNEITFILRSKDKGKLTEDLNQCFDELKKFKGISFKIEVDPVNLV